MFFTTVGFLIIVGFICWFGFWAAIELKNFALYRVSPDTFDWDDLGEALFLIGVIAFAIFCLIMAFTFAPFSIEFALEVKK